MKASNPFTGLFNGLVASVVLFIGIMVFAFVAGVTVGYAIEVFDAGFSLSQ